MRSVASDRAAGDEQRQDRRDLGSAPHDSFDETREEVLLDPSWSNLLLTTP
jgi:hypothetical protein